MSRTARRWAARLAILVTGLVAGGLPLVGPMAVLPSASAATCTSGGGVSVVVDFRELGGSTITACAPDGGGKSAAAGRRVGRGQHHLRHPAAGLRVPGPGGAGGRPVRQHLTGERLLGALVGRRLQGLVDLLVLRRRRSDRAGRWLGGLVVAAGPGEQRCRTTGRRSAGGRGHPVAHAVAHVVADLDPQLDPARHPARHPARPRRARRRRPRRPAAAGRSRPARPRAPVAAAAARAAPRRRRRARPARRRRPPSRPLPLSLLETHRQGAGPGTVRGRGPTTPPPTMSLLETQRRARTPRPPTSDGESPGDSTPSADPEAGQPTADEPGRIPAALTWSIFGLLAIAIAGSAVVARRRRGV